MAARARQPARSETLKSPGVACPVVSIDYRHQDLRRMAATRPRASQPKDSNCHRRRRLNFDSGEPATAGARSCSKQSPMGLQALEGSWLEGQDALLSTAVGALTFWLLGAVVGLLVCH